MNTREPDARATERFAHAAAGLLRQGAGELDAATLSRLNRGRQAALARFERARQRRAWLRGSGWGPAVAAAVVVIAVGLWTGRPAPTSLPPPGDVAAVMDDAAGPARAADLEVVLVDDNLELIEDLEFYDWMTSGGGEGPGTDLTG